MASEKERPGVMLYFREITSCTKRLSLSEKGKLFDAILNYAESGIYPDIAGDEIALSVAWDVVQEMIDRDGQKYKEKVVKSRFAAFCKQRKAAGEPEIGFSEWYEKVYPCEVDEPSGR